MILCRVEDVSQSVSFSFTFASNLYTHADRLRFLLTQLIPETASFSWQIAYKAIRLITRAWHGEQRCDKQAPECTAHRSRLVGYVRHSFDHIKRDLRCDLLSSSALLQQHPETSHHRRHAGKTSLRMMTVKVKRSARRR